MVNKKFGGFFFIEIYNTNCLLGLMKDYASCMPASAGISKDEMHGVAMRLQKAVATLFAHKPQVAVSKLLSKTNAQT